MAFHIKNAETDALARRVATLRNIGLTEAVHGALQRDLDVIKRKPSLTEASLAFVHALHAKACPEKGRPADKDFIDSLYEDD